MESVIKKISLGLLLVLLCMPCAWAQDSPQPDEKSTQTDGGSDRPVFTLGEIEVIGKKEPNNAVNKVYEEEMRQFDRNNLADAVNLVPGVTLSFAGARNEMMVNVRGLDIKHVPIYLDGIPIYVPYDGYPDLARFTTFDLSEIVVSKGDASVLYGPNTMAGAINMVSRRPQKELEINGGVGIASGLTYTSYLNLGAKQEKFYVQIGASYVDSDGFHLSDSYTPTKVEDGDKRANSYYQDWRGSIKIGFTPNNTDEYALSYISQHGEKGVPPYAGTDSSTTTRYWRWPYWDKRSLYFNSNTALGKSSYIKSRLYYDELENQLNSYDDATYSTMTKKYTFKSFYDDHTMGGTLEFGTSLLPRQMLKVAVHLKKDYHEEHNEGDPVQKFEDEIFSLGVEDTIDITDKLYTIVGFGFDQVRTIEAQDNDNGTLVDFEKETAQAFNPQVGLYYRVAEDGLAHVSVAAKSRIPSIKDKYSYKMGKALPNPDLDPERSINYEIGYRHNLLKRIKLEGNIFYSNVTDYILSATVPDPTSPGDTLLQNQNVGEVNIYGFELGVSGQLFKRLNGGLNYTYLQYDNESNDDRLVDTPEHKVFAYLQYFITDRFSVMGNVEFDSKRYSSSDGVRIAQGYTVAGAKLSYQATDWLCIEGGVNNIFDDDYEICEGYPEAGRTFFANARFSF